MAVNSNQPATLTIPTGAVEQPSNTATLNESKVLSFQRAFKGPYTALETWCKTIKQGDKLGNQIVRSFSLRRHPADQGVLSFNLYPDDTTENDDGTKSQEPLDEVWSIKSVRNDVSLMRYCDDAGGDSPVRVHMELWLKETNKDVADADKYTTGEDGSEAVDLTSAEAELAKKFRKGFDSVMRFYVLLTCKRTYSTPPARVLENLMTIDTPSTGSKFRGPGNMSTIISDYEWLKVQDDADEQTSGEWARTESWMGVLKSEGEWDENFYGTTDRWTMPYHHS